MSKNQTNTKKEEIIKYWIGKIDETDLNFDWSDADYLCWNCGCKRKTQRCHIVPHSLGGADDPSNYVLLCNVCHSNAPNCSNGDIMWDWIKSNRTQFGLTNCYFIEKGLEEYQRIYKKDIVSDMISHGITEDNVVECFREYNQENKISTHFSNSHFNPVSTAGYVKGLLDNLKENENTLIRIYTKEYESKLRRWEDTMKKPTNVG